MDTIVAVIGLAIVLGGPFIIWGRAMESRVLAIEVHNDERGKVEDKSAGEQREWRALMTTQMGRISDQMTQMQISIGVINGKASGGSSSH